MTGALRYVRCGIFLMTLFACAYNLTGASASSDSTPEWIPSENSVMVTADADLAAASPCVNQKIDVVTWRPGPTDPYAQSADACVVSNGDVDIATTYTLENGYRHGVAVKLAGDAYYRHISISQNAVKVSGNGDAVAYLDYDSVGNVTKLTTVSDLLHSIEPEAFDAVGNAQSYQLKPTAKRAWMERSSGSNSYHNTYTYAISDNGRYVAAYVDYLGIVKIDLQSGSVERALYSPGAWYSPLNNPTPMAITDDGRYILTAPDLRVIDTVSCTQPFGNGFDPYQPDHCPTRALAQQVSDVIGYTFHLSAARFTDDNYSIEAATTLFPGTQPTQGDGSPRHVKVSLEGHDDGRLQYLSLGDSYSSGEGDMGKDENGNDYYIQNGDVNCHLSSRSYPFLLRNAWHISDTSMRSVACSGAMITKDYTSPLAEYPGQRNELKNLPDTISRQSFIDSTLQYFVPGRVPQIEFVKKYKPKVITLTGSGNDVGFADILTYCAGDWESLIIVTYSCEYVEGGALHTVLNDAIDSQYSKIKELIEAIKVASPDSKVYYIGYPSFIAGSEAQCALNSAILSDPERDMINGAISRLNSVIRKATAATGVEYVNIEDSLKGGRLCEGSEYMTGVWDTGWVAAANGDAPGAFHPNADGHKAIAGVVQNKVKNPIDDYVPEPLEVHAIQPSTPTYRAQIIEDDTVSEGEMLVIDLAPDTAVDSSDIFVTAFSTPTSLGSYKAASDGSLHVSVRLPKVVNAGEHLLVLDLTGKDGKSERLYEYFHVAGVNKESSTTVVDKQDSVASWQPGNVSQEYNNSTIVSDRNSGDGGVLIQDKISHNMVVAKSTTSIDTQERKSDTITKAAILVLGLIGGVFLYVKNRKI